MFRGLSGFIVFLSATSHTRNTPDRHTTSRGSVESIPWGVGCLPSPIGSLPVCSDLIRPEMGGGGEWVYPRWFTMYRLKIGLESRLHPVLLPILGNIGCLPWQKSLRYRYNIVYKTAQKKSCIFSLVANICANIISTTCLVWLWKPGYSVFHSC